MLRELDARFRGHERMDASTSTERAVLCARWRRDGGAVVNAEAAEAGQLHRRVAKVEPCDEAEKIEFHAFDPAELHAEHAPQRRFDTGAGVGEPDIGKGAEVLAD